MRTSQDPVIALLSIACVTAHWVIGHKARPSNKKGDKTRDFVAIRHINVSKISVFPTFDSFFLWTVYFISFTPFAYRPIRLEIVVSC
jgi:hypothetical protein